MLEEYVVNQLTSYQRDSAARQRTCKKVLAVEKVKIEIDGISPMGVQTNNPISSCLQYLMPKTKAAYKFQKKFSQLEKEKYCASKYDPVTVSPLLS